MPLKPFFRTFDGWWYAQIRIGNRRKQVKLIRGKANEKEAYRAFCRLMADEAVPGAVGANQQIATICDLFLDDSLKANTPSTFSLHQRFLQDFCSRYGQLMVSDLKPFHINRWLDAHPTWKACRWHAIGIVKRALNWAEEQGYISANPIRRMKKPPLGRRNRILTEQERAEILAAIPDESFRQFVLAMTETGCRPSEVARLTAKQVRLDEGLWVIENHKTAKKTGRPRTIYLSPAMVDLSREP
jgi:site-specific recombinase XerD